LIFKERWNDVVTVVKVDQLIKVTHGGFVVVDVIPFRFWCCDTLLISLNMKKRKIMEG
jgi:hypothetical protein